MVNNLFGFDSMDVYYYTHKGGAVWDENLTYGSGTEILWTEWRIFKEHSVLVPIAVLHDSKN